MRQSTLFGFASNRRLWASNFQCELD